MSRPVGSKNRAKPKLQPMDLTDAKKITLTPNGKDLLNKIKNKWVLDEVALELATVAAIAVSEAERCHEVLQKEGYTMKTRYDETRNHPMLKQEQAFLSTASGTLSKLQMSLG